MRSSLRKVLIFTAATVLHTAVASAANNGACGIEQIDAIESELYSLKTSTINQHLVSVGVACGQLRSNESPNSLVKRLLRADHAALDAKPANFDDALANVAGAYGINSPEYAQLRETLQLLLATGGYEAFSGKTWGEDRDGTLFALVDRKSGSVLVMELQAR